MSKVNPHNPRTITGINLDTKNLALSFQDLNPGVDLAYTLGNSILRWKDVFAGAGVFETSVSCSGIIQGATLVGLTLTTNLVTALRLLVTSTNTAGNRNDLDAALHVAGGIACNENIWSKSLRSDTTIEAPTSTVTTSNSTTSNATTTNSTNLNVSSSATLNSLNCLNATVSNASLSKITNTTTGNPSSATDTTCPNSFAGGMAVAGLLHADSLTVDTTLSIPSVTVPTGNFTTLNVSGATTLNTCSANTSVISGKVEYAFKRHFDTFVTFSGGSPGPLFVTGPILKTGLIEIDPVSTASTIILVSASLIRATCNNEANLVFDLLIRNRSTLTQTLSNFAAAPINLLAGQRIFFRLMVSVNTEIDVIQLPIVTVTP